MFTNHALRMYDPLGYELRRLAVQLLKFFSPFRVLVVRL